MENSRSPDKSSGSEADTDREGRCLEEMVDRFAGDEDVHYQVKSHRSSVCTRIKQMKAHINCILSRTAHCTAWV